MEARAITRYIRIAPRKMRLVINMIRSKPLEEAYAILAHLNKKAARLVKKTLKSAEANAKVKKMDENRLYIRAVRADGGPMLKRHMARAMGRADVILKRMTHLDVILGEREARVSTPPAEKAKSKTQAMKPSEKAKGREKEAVGAAG